MGVQQNMDFREVGWEDRRCMEQAYNCVQWRTLVLAVLNLSNLLPDSWLLGLDREWSETERPKSFRY
jgi:hypothetical protein